MTRRGNIYNKDNDEVTVIKENVKKQKQDVEQDIFDEIESNTYETVNTQEETKVEPVTEEVDENIKENINNNTKESSKRNKKQLIFLIIYIIIAVSVTTILLVLRNNKLNSDVSTNNNTNDTVDVRYGITDYKEMYYINPLTFKDEQYYKERSSGKYRTEINYITVSGLKNKELQDKINKEIKDVAYKYYNNIGSKEDYLVYTSVGANYSNILSINISLLMWDNTKEEYRINEEIGLNYNLVTGEKLLFTDIFEGDTPINYIIYDMAYEALAWDTKIDFESDEIEWDKHTNMDNRDTSEYEDIILKNILDFRSIKDEEREFYLTSSRVHIKMKLGNNEEAFFAGIPSYQYAEYITIYKKFLVDNSKLKEIYETMPSKKSLVFTDNIGIDKYFADHIYDNLYLDLTVMDNEDYDEEAYKDYPESTIILKDELIEKKIVDITNNVKGIARENTKYGYIARAMIDTYIATYENDYGSEDYIEVRIDSVIDRADIDYYNKSAFKSLAARVLSPKVDVWGALLGELDDKNITRLEKETKYEAYYYDTNGKLIGRDWDELEKYMNNKYKEVVIEKPVDIYSE